MIEHATYHRVPLPLIKPNNTIPDIWPGTTGGRERRGNGECILISQGAARSPNEESYGGFFLLFGGEYMTRKCRRFPQQLTSRSILLMLWHCVTPVRDHHNGGSGGRRRRCCLCRLHCWCARGGTTTFYAALPNNPGSDAIVVWIMPKKSLVHIINHGGVLFPLPSSPPSIIITFIVPTSSSLHCAGA